jgi:PST family polysaccharide transporter
MSGAGTGSAPADEAAAEDPSAGSMVEAPSAPIKKSHGEILKSSALIGGSAGFSMLLGLLRNKVLAVLLGQHGFGLIGMYSSIAELARGIAGLGIKSSGVRQIAEAVGSGDTLRVARTVTTLRRVAFYSGAVGAVLLAAFARPIAKASFGDYERAGAVALLALVVFFTDISEAQAALVQGMRRIADLARLSILGALFGTVFSIAIVYLVKERGIVPSLVCVALMSIITSWWYARKVGIQSVRVSFGEVWEEASSLVKLGVIFMTSALSMQAATYVIRLIIIREMGIDEAGYYHAAWALSGMYIMFILNAMAADFYPRLTGVAQRNPECNRLVNEQAEVGLLMAGPGILGTLTFAPLAITVCYTSDFAPAAGILRWLCLGMLMRVISWPMAFILLARGERKLYFWSEILSNSAYVALVWAAVKAFGLAGTGIGFFGLNVCYFIGIYIIAQRLTGFRWSPESLRLMGIFAPLVAIVFLAGCFLSSWWAAVAGLLITIPACFYSLKLLCRLVPFDRLPRPAQKLLRLLRFNVGTG